MDYSTFNFTELNQMIMEQKENSSKELITMTIYKGINVMEVYSYKLSRQYNINLSTNDVEEIVNQMLDNVTKYFDIKKSYNIRAYMYITTRGKFLNYFRDRIKGVRLEGMVKANSESQEEVEFAEKESELSDYLEKKIMVREAFTMLSDRCKKSIYYRKFLNLSIKEIMEKMKLETMNETAVRKAISNCFKKLKEHVFGGV